MNKTEEGMQWYCQQRNRNRLVFSYHVLNREELYVCGK